MRFARSAVAAAVLVAAATTAGCTGQSGPEACVPVAGGVTVSLADDRGALPARVWLPVVSAKGDYAARLAPLDLASRSLTTAELDAIADNSGTKRRAAVAAAVADVSEGDASGAYELLVPDSDDGRAAGDFYAAALERQGYQVRIDTASADAALSAAAEPKSDRVALLELAELIETVGAEAPEGGLNGQLQAAATAAVARSLAVGSPSVANRTPQVLVTQAFVAANGDVADLSGLAKACPGIKLTATEAAAKSLAPLAAAYGLTTADAATEALDQVRAGQAAAVLAHDVG